MEKLKIIGGNPLVGQVRIAGAKNAALPLLAATILASDHPVILRNIPHLRDITTMLSLLAEMGAKTMLCESSSLHIDTRTMSSHLAPYSLVKQMRASILVLGPLLGRFGKAKISLPGGCAIGSRPVDLHLKAMAQMGAQLDLNDGYIEAKVDGRLQGKEIYFDKVTVTGTENVMMAAVLAQGSTVILNAAREPEIEDLACFLKSMGAKISGEGTDVITIEGIDRLQQGGEYAVMFDRIEAGTYLAAVLMTTGDVTLKSVIPNQMQNILHVLSEMGAEITVGHDWVRCQMHTRPKAVSVKTDVYPGFPTDMQAQIMAINTIAQGSATVIESIFENRFMHVQELVRMGAQIELHGNTAVIHGIEQLKGAPVMATDLRASASLVLAGLAAQGETVIDRIYHICRGYERIEEKFRALGANIERVQQVVGVS